MTQRNSTVDTEKFQQREVNEQLMRITEPQSIFHNSENPPGGGGGGGASMNHTCVRTLVESSV